MELSKNVISPGETLKVPKRAQTKINPEPKSFFTTPEELLKELERQRHESEDEIEESCSEDEDDSLINDDDQEDVFSADDENADIEFDSNSDERSFFLGKDVQTIWTDKPLQSKFSRTPLRNLVIHLPGPKNNAKNMCNEYKLFSLFITDEITEMIVKFTNAEIERKKKSYQSNQWYIFPTDKCEIKALFGVYIRAGLTKQSHANTEDMFSSIDGSPIFRCTMSKNRFEFLTTALRFDDKNTRSERKANDKFAAFREVWNLFTTNCKLYYTPSEWLTVDETLLSFRGRCPFKMFLPSKPDKYGLKIISLCDARTFYFLDGIPYVGKEEAYTRTKESLSLPTQYVLKLAEVLKNSNRNITTDNWFTSCELADELKKMNLTLVGTLRKNKPQLPEFMVNTRNKPVRSSTFLFEPAKMLVSFIPKKNKNVVLLSTMHSSGEINSITQKPEIIEYYNVTKGGVDAFDQLCHDKTSKRKTRRWPMRYLYGLLDFAVHNSYVLYKWNTGKETYSTRERRNYIKALSLSLMEPLMKKRMVNDHISKDLRLSIKNIVGEDDGSENKRNNQYAASKKPRRCDVCSENNKNKDRKGYAFCAKCNMCVCGEHKNTICPQCLSND